MMWEYLKILVQKIYPYPKSWDPFWQLKRDGQTIGSAPGHPSLHRTPAQGATSLNTKYKLPIDRHPLSSTCIAWSVSKHANLPTKALQGLLSNGNPPLRVLPRVVFSIACDRKLSSQICNRAITIALRICPTMPLSRHIWMVTILNRQPENKLNCLQRSRMVKAVRWKTHRTNPQKRLLGSGSVWPVRRLIIAPKHMINWNRINI